jgi:hypothetical protein
VPPGAGQRWRGDAWPGAVLGVVDAVSCRGASDAELAVLGLVVSGGEVMSGTGAVAVGAGIVRGAGALLAVCLDEAFDKRIDVARLG